MFMQVQLQRWLSPSLSGLTAIICCNMLGRTRARQSIGFLVATHHCYHFFNFTSSVTLITQLVLQNVRIPT